LEHLDLASRAIRQKAAGEALAERDPGHTIAMRVQDYQQRSDGR